VASGEYSKDRPQLHATVELPLDLPGVRSARRSAAAASLGAATYRFRYDSAGVALDADTAYTFALAARERARLSRLVADAADTLHRMAARRAEAGDAAEMDVLLAGVTAGQAQNSALGDSLDAVARLLDLQAVMGLPADRPRIALASPLDLPDAEPGDSAALARLAGDASGAAAPSREAATLPVAAALADVRAAELGLRAQRRSLWGQPSVIAGAEFRGDEPGALPVVGISIPLPLLDRNRGPIAQAEAERARANAALARARLEGQSELAHIARALTVARARARRDRLLLGDAERVAAMSLTAYREGASSLPAVLEARRTVRDVTREYVDDVAAALVASAELRHLQMTP
jgi:cobalt-zinc-cadmium efflux system outer membrane protein